MADADWMGSLESRLGRVVLVNGDGSLVIEGCSPRAGDRVQIVGHSLVAARRRLSAPVARDLLARHMWIADELRKAADEIAGIQAAEEWDDDRLLTDTYERFEQMATDAIFAAMQAKEDEPNG